MATGTGNLPNPGMSFSPFEILTAEEQNNLVENIESLATGTGVGDGAIDTTQLADASVTSDKLDNATFVDLPIWWEEIGRTTLESSADSITVAALPARKYLKVIVNLVASSSIDGKIRFNNDSGANYGYLLSSNGGAQAAQVSQSGFDIVSTSTSYPVYASFEAVNVSSVEKIVRLHSLNTGISGGTSAPSFTREVFGKWANTSSQITSISVSNSQPGDYTAGSEVIVLGHN